MVSLSVQIPCIFTLRWREWRIVEQERRVMAGANERAVRDALFDRAYITWLGHYDRHCHAPRWQVIRA